MDNATGAEYFVDTSLDHRNSYVFNHRCNVHTIKASQKVFFYCVEVFTDHNIHAHTLVTRISGL